MECKRCRLLEESINDLQTQIKVLVRERDHREVQIRRAICDLNWYLRFYNITTDFENDLKKIKSILDLKK
jgi:hypothetical protein